MLALGTATGLIVTLIWGPIISSWGGGNLSDALTLLGAVSVLIVVGAIACVLPAWRAATLDPNAGAARRIATRLLQIPLCPPAVLGAFTWRNVVSLSETEGPDRGLYGHLPEQELNLLQLSARSMAKPRTRPLRS